MFVELALALDPTGERQFTYVRKPAFKWFGFTKELTPEERKAQTSEARNASIESRVLWDAKFKLTDSYTKNYFRIANNINKNKARGSEKNVAKWELEMENLRALNDEFVREQAAAKQIRVKQRAEKVADSIQKKSD